jgi:protein-glutamine gamma-glutamyltransferase
VITHFGADARGLADWLLKLEAQRYARVPASSLNALRREFHQLCWPR